MSYLEDGYYTDAVANAPENVRLAFIRKTYMHVAGATAACVGIDALLLATPLGKQLFTAIVSAGPIAWIMLFVLFMGSGFISRGMARSRNLSTQYLGLALYVAIEAIILLPILVYADHKFPGKNLPMQAGVITLLVFGGLSAAVFLSKKDFSFLGVGLQVLGWGAFALVIASLIGGFSLGLWFSFLMVALVCGYILYDTSNVLHHYGENEYVGASLELFADVAMLFYYVLRILLDTTSSSD